MNLRVALVSLSFLALLGAAAGAQESGKRAPLDLTVIDVPYNLSFGGRAPSMQQSLDLTVGAYEVTHGAIERAFGKRRRLGRAATVLYDIVTSGLVPLPLTQGWLHEEFHRAQMGRRGVGSFNDVYLFNFGADAIAVSHERDEDLAALKANHPAEWVRVNSAGMEGELLLVRELETRSFRGHSRGTHIALYWLSKYSTAVYIASSTSPDTDAETDAYNRMDGSNVARRDFTGHDFLAWTYDLHRPTEPYAARGTHPSGVGIDRYIKLADLTEEERNFVALQGRLQNLNFVDPFLFGIKGVKLGGGANPTLATASLSHFLTASGYAIDANVLLKRGDDAASIIAHAYVNAERTLPGVEATLFDRPGRIAGRAVELTPRVALWLQPKGQAFRTRTMTPGGLLSLRARTAGRSRLRGFLEMEAKTAGWVAGTPYLDAGLTLRSGVTTSLR